MSFIHTQESFGPYTKEVITNASGTSVSIIPELGARLNNFVIPIVEGQTDIIDGYSDLGKLESEYYSKSSLLAPFPNRIADGRYDFEGVEYQLPINKEDENNSIHGFVSNQKFDVIKSEDTEEGYVLELQHLSEPYTGFPFQFCVSVIYVLDKQNTLQVKTEIKNTGDKTMPIGFGWHPYFTLGGKIEDTTLRLPVMKQLETDGRLIPTGEMYEVGEWREGKVIDQAQFDTGFQLVSDDRLVTITDFTKGIEIKVELGQLYDYVQVFTPPWRTSIAIEPMTCAANAFNNKLGLHVLTPKESLTAHFSVQASLLTS